MDTTIATMSTLPAPCLTVDGRPVHYAPMVTPEQYVATWAARKDGTPVRTDYYRCTYYVSTYVEADDGTEIEVSALVDLRRTETTVDDVRCRVHPEGPEVEIDAATIADAEERLIDAAVDAARRTA